MSCLYRPEIVRCLRKGLTVCLLWSLIFCFTGTILAQRVVGGQCGICGRWYEGTSCPYCSSASSGSGSSAIDGFTLGVQIGQEFLKVLEQGEQEEQRRQVEAKYQQERQEELQRLKAAREKLEQTNKEMDQIRQMKERLMRIEQGRQLKSSFDGQLEDMNSNLDGVLDVPAAPGTDFFGIKSNPDGVPLDGHGDPDVVDLRDRTRVIPEIPDGDEQSEHLSVNGVDRGGASGLVTRAPPSPTKPLAAPRYSVSERIYMKMPAEWRNVYHSGERAYRGGKAVVGKIQHVKQNWKEMVFDKGKDEFREQALGSDLNAKVDKAGVVRRLTEGWASEHVNKTLAGCSDGVSAMGHGRLPDDGYNPFPAAEKLKNDATDEVKSTIKDAAGIPDIPMIE